MIFFSVHVHGSKAWNKTCGIKFKLGCCLRGPAETWAETRQWGVNDLGFEFLVSPLEALVWWDTVAYTHPRGYVAESRTGELSFPVSSPGKQASSCDPKHILAGRLGTKLGGI